MTNKPIELYFTDTPNGWKISIMLEGKQDSLQNNSC